MIFYRSPRMFRAVTLDLDDTLYDNHPVIARAEDLFMEYLTGRFSALELLMAAVRRHQILAL